MYSGCRSTFRAPGLSNNTASRSDRGSPSSSLFNRKSWVTPVFSTASSTRTSRPFQNGRRTEENFPAVETIHANIPHFRTHEMADQRRRYSADQIGPEHKRIFEHHDHVQSLSGVVLGNRQTQLLHPCGQALTRKRRSLSSPSEPLFQNNHSDPRFFTCARIARRRKSASPNDVSRALEDRPAQTLRRGHAPRQKHLFQFPRPPVSLGPVRIPWTPAPQNQGGADEPGIESFTVPFSVALRERPVNHFQAESGTKFRDRNTRGASVWQSYFILVRAEPIFGFKRGFGIPHPSRFLEKITSSKILSARISPGRTQDFPLVALPAR